MNECQHTDERMNDNEKAVHDNIDGRTAKQREREEETENRPKIKKNTREVKHLLWCLHVSFFPRNKTKWVN